MNLKKVISIFASLALTVSCFAGSIISTNAEGDDFIEIAKYVKLASWSADNKAATQTVIHKNSDDADFATTKVHGGIGPSSNSSNYPAIGVIQFTFENTNSYNIEYAKLTMDLSVSGSNRTANIYTVADSDYDISTIPIFSTSDSANDGIYTQTATGTKWTYSNVIGEFNSVYAGTGLSGTTQPEIDVTDYVKSQTKSEDGKCYAMFGISNAIAGGDILNPVLTIKYIDPTAARKNYTINYKVAGNETPVKVTSGTDVVGTEIVTESVFEVGEGETMKRYYITADTAPILTISNTDSENILDIPVREADKYEMKVVPSTDETKEFVSATIIEGDKFSYKYSKYVTDANKKVLASTDEATFTKEVTPTKSETIKIPYTAYEGNAWFVEGESINTSGGAVSDNRLSGGTARRSLDSAKEMFAVVEDGVYDITFVGCTNRVAANYTCDMSVYKGSAEAENLIKTVDLTGASVNKIKTEKIATGMTLKAGDKILVKGNDSNPAVDYILFEKTGNIAPEIITGTVTENAPEISTDTTVTAVTANAPVFDKIALGVNVIKTISVKVDNSEENVTPVLYVNDTAAQTTWTADENGVYYAQFAVPSVGDFADFGTVKVVYGSGDGAIEKTINITE